jgi:hypothetical protein
LKGSHFSVQGTGVPSIDLNNINANISQAFAGMQTGLIILIAVTAIVVALAFILLIYWLGARGQFMFLDNLVRNRGAISQPWSRYARQADSVFGFYLLVMAVSLVIMLPIIAVAIVMGLPLWREHRWPVGGEIAGFAALGVVYLGVAIVFGVVLFLFREFGIPIMFRQGLLARPAFLAAMNLARSHPGSVTLFILLRIALFFAVAICSLVLCCGTLLCCCASQWPYVGTVLLLPALVYVRCFTLDCLAQFGPEYDVWTVDSAPPIATGGPFNPQRPPG